MEKNKNKKNHVGNLGVPKGYRPRKEGIRYSLLISYMLLQRPIYWQKKNLLRFFLPISVKNGIKNNKGNLFFGFEVKQ